VLSVKDAAERAGVSRSLIYAWCRTGVLRHSRFGLPGKRGVVRIAESDLLEFLEGCKHEGRPAVAGSLPLKHIS
jgi:excisionase family DNA binding protein